MRTTLGTAGLSVALVFAAGAAARTPADETVTASAKTPAAVKPVANEPAKAAAKVTVPADGRPRIDVVLDTTGSMGGLIEGAKAKIWSIANQRKELRAQVTDLVKKRQAYIADETKKAAAGGKGSAFDVEVARTLEEQAKRKDIAFGTTP